VGMRRGIDRHTETAVTNIHFASATPHAKCNKQLNCDRFIQKQLSKACSVVYQ